MFASGKSRNPWFERVILLGPDEYQSCRHSIDLGNLPGDSNNEDKTSGAYGDDKDIEIS